ncbi:MAG: MltA domain-containing protein [Oceanicaulis sp.]|nr:MltA domain-containing protein [Oceanicaulis sp.]
MSIGRILIDRGELSEHNASKQDIEDWLRLRGPQSWRPLFDENPRYVFFTLDSLDDHTEGPIGAQGAPLTRWRRLRWMRRTTPGACPWW